MWGVGWVVGGGFEGCAGGFLDFAPRFRFARPVEFVMVGGGDVVYAEQFFEFVDVNLVVADEFGRELGKECF